MIKEGEVYRITGEEEQFVEQAGPERRLSTATNPAALFA